MITLNALYYIVGVMFFVFGILNFLNTTKTWLSRIACGMFWLSYSLTFLLAEVLSPFMLGLLVLVLAFIAGANLLKHSPSPQSTEELEFAKHQASLFKNKLFLPALLVPIITLAGTFLLPHIPLFEPKNPTLISLILGIIAAFICATLMLKASPTQAIANASKIMDNISWAALLPQILATLGILFVGAGMGDSVAKLLSNYFSFDNAFLSVCAYTFFMALFTIIMGNAFAAFPVITAGIAYPILISNMGANPAIVGAIGMLSGFCGTLMTPMAANFNIVPAALLELDDKNGVIKAQFMSGLILLILNTLLMYFLAFRF